MDNGALAAVDMVYDVDGVLQLAEVVMSLADGSKILDGEKRKEERKKSSFFVGPFERYRPSFWRKWRQAKKCAKARRDIGGISARLSLEVLKVTFRQWR